MPQPQWPFVGAEALRARQVSERAMRNTHEQIYPGVFVPRGIEPSARQRAVAAWLWSKRRGVIAGQSAAALLGTKWIDGMRPAELIHDNRKPPAGLVVHTDWLAPGETVDVDRMPGTESKPCSD